MPSVEELAALQARLRAQFRDTSILEQALRHRSSCMDAPEKSNERLEFLGDSVVGIVVCEYLFGRFPASSEGDLAKAKAYLASEPVLAEAAETLDIGSALDMSASEESSGGRARRSILSDAFEAVVAAVFLDQGMRSARRLVRSALKPAMERVAHAGYHPDFKSQLQERTQAKSRKAPHYKITAELGAEHDRTFVAQAILGARVIGEGSGKSKKEAEQQAARHALESMGAA